MHSVPLHLLHSIRIFKLEQSQVILQIRKIETQRLNDSLQITAGEQQSKPTHPHATTTHAAPQFYQQTFFFHIKYFYVSTYLTLVQSLKERSNNCYSE